MMCFRCGAHPEWPPAKTEKQGWWQTSDGGLTFAGFYWCHRHKFFAGADKLRFDERIRARELAFEADRLYHKWEKP